MTLFWGILIGLGIGAVVGLFFLAYALQNPWSRW
jgi:hypothetical protein